jgi:hypothetical protein
LKHVKVVFELQAGPQIHKTLSLAMNSDLIFKSQIKHPHFYGKQIRDNPMAKFCMTKSKLHKLPIIGQTKHRLVISN